MVDMTGCAQIVLDTDLRDPANPFTLDPECSFHLIHEPCWATPYLLLPNVRMIRSSARSPTSCGSWLRNARNDEHVRLLNLGDKPHCPL